MKTISLKKGDRLQALVARPVSAAIERGEIVVVVGFDRDGAPNVRSGPTSPFAGITWDTSLRDLFHDYKKLKGGK